MSLKNSKWRSRMEGKTNNRCYCVNPKKFDIGRKSKHKHAVIITQYMRYQLANWFKDLLCIFGSHPGPLLFKEFFMSTTFTFDFSSFYQLVQKTFYEQLFEGGNSIYCFAIPLSYVLRNFLCFTKYQRKKRVIDFQDINFPNCFICKLSNNFYCCNV